MLQIRIFVLVKEHRQSDSCFCPCGGQMLVINETNKKVSVSIWWKVFFKVAFLPRMWQTSRFVLDIMV